VNKLLSAFSATLLASAALAADAPSGLPAPPAASMAVVQCKKPLVIWVIMQDGKAIRFDKDHRPSTEAATLLFLQWVDTGPVDVYELPCAISVKN